MREVAVAVVAQLLLPVAGVPAALAVAFGIIGPAAAGDTVLAAIVGFAVGMLLQLVVVAETLHGAISRAVAWSDAVAAVALGAAGVVEEVVAGQLVAEFAAVETAAVVVVNFDNAVAAEKRSFAEVELRLPVVLFENPAS